MSVLRGIITLAILPSVAVAQSPPGTRLSVTVRVTTVTMRLDTSDITYVVKNEASSAESLAQFAVDAPAPVYQVFDPAPGHWFISKKVGSRSAAVWAALDVQTPPGQDTPSLRFVAVGLPAIVTSWTQGYYSVPDAADAAADTMPESDVLTTSVLDTTVGVEPFPVDRTAAGLIVRLRGLLTQACGTSLPWITSSSVCNSLDAELDTASQRLSVADTAGTRAKIQEFNSTLTAQHGTGLPVNDSAYWLLKANADYVLNRRL